MDFIVDLDKLVHGQISDSTVRKLIRYGLARFLAEKAQDDVATQQRHFTAFVRQLQESAISPNTLAANTQHYEVPAAFFQLVLGKHLKYSAGYWPEGVTTLDDSEAAMLQLICDRAGIADGQTILDLGCGWGSFSLYVAEKYPHCHLTGLSTSRSQKAFIDAQATCRGLHNVQVITADIAAFETTATFDRVVSIEMFEHLRNYEALLAKIAAWMTPESRLFVHIFTHRCFPYLMEQNWLAEHFFTGGMMPSHHLLPAFDQACCLQEQWQVSGLHYQKTSQAWLDNADTHRDAILEVFAHTYGAEQAARMLVMWRLFFLLCAESFGYNGGQEWMVSHYCLAKRG